MTDHSQTRDDAPGVSPATVHAASRACRALAAGDVDVSGVQFNYTDDSFRIVLDGGDVGTPSDGFDPQGIGGGTIKS